MLRRFRKLHLNCRRFPRRSIRPKSKIANVLKPRHYPIIIHLGLFRFIFILRFMYVLCCLQFLSLRCLFVCVLIMNLTPHKKSREDSYDGMLLGQFWEEISLAGMSRSSCRRLTSNCSHMTVYLCECMCVCVQMSFLCSIYTDTQRTCASAYKSARMYWPSMEVAVIVN